MKKILIIGATSAIAEATARRCAARGDKLFLLARNQERLAMIASDLKIRGAAAVAYEALDLNALDRHDAVIANAIAELGGLDIALIAHGTLGDQKAGEQSFATTLQELNTNFIGAVSLLTYLANYFEKQRNGSIAVISSVAGDRGRQSNYIYGAAKGGLSIFLQGLRNRLHKTNVQVLTIKPGFVDTPMTAHLPKGALWAQPDAIAQGILAAIERRKDVVYLPFFWAFIMLIIKHVPEKIFKKLSL